MNWTIALAVILIASPALVCLGALMCAPSLDDIEVRRH